MERLEISGEFITGVSLGFEFVQGEVMGDDNLNYVVIDLLIFRVLLAFFKS